MKNKLVEKFIYLYSMSLLFIYLILALPLIFTRILAKYLILFFAIFLVSIVPKGKVNISKDFKYLKNLMN